MQSGGPASHGQPQSAPRVRAPFQVALDELAREFATPAQQALLSDYPRLMRLYDEDIEVVYEATEEICCRLIAQSKIPDLTALDQQHGDYNNGVSVSHDPLTRSVKRTFFEAMENLQTSQLPKKHRGNLPKEAVAVFKRWFDDHHDHPYPADEVKIALSNETGVELNQITNWFINHRKRVWKPQLPDNHPLKGNTTRRQSYPPL